MTQLEYDRNIAVTRKEWFAALTLSRGTLANAENINTIQARILAGLEEFAGAVDETMLKLITQLVAQVSAIEQMQLRFEGKVNARVAEIRAELLAIIDAFTTAQLARITAFQEQIMKRLTELDTALRAEIAAAKAEMIVQSQRYTDTAYAKLQKLLFRTRYYETYFTPDVKAVDLLNYQDVETSEYTIFECPPDMRFYIHGYSWRVWLTDQKWLLEPGVAATTTIASFVHQEGPGGGVVPLQSEPIDMLRPGQKVLGQVAVNGGTWDYYFRMQGYLVPRPLWDVWPKDGVI